MNYKYFILFFAIIIFSSTLFAYSIGFDYADVRSTSYPVYMPYQYAGVYDTIDLRYSLYGNGLTAPVNVVVSPKVYGINLSGQRIFVHNVQTQSFLIQPYGNFVYSYNPMFYFDPAYQSYEVVLDLQALDGSYQTATSSYIYLNGTTGGNQTPPDPTFENPTCDDFYISGFSDIYLDEDSRDFYNLYIINSIDDSLAITSITTTPIDPENLEIENITYPYNISSYQTRSAQIDLFTDTVSSNYSDSFDINVKGKYGDLTCEKSYSVNYRINDEDLPNNSDCDDIRISNTYFTLNSNESKNVSVNIENESLDYYFDIDSIKLNEPTNSIVDASLRNNIYSINEDSSKSLNLNLNADETTVYKTEDIELKIDGYLKRTNREDRRCRINETISVRVSPNSSTTSNECKDISIFSRNVSIEENTLKNYSKTDGFYLYNNSNKKFIVTGVDYIDNSGYLDVYSKAVDNYIFPKSSGNISFDLKSKIVSSNIDAKTNIVLKGYFENGDTCSFLDIKSEFNVGIVKNAVCSNVGFLDSYFKDGVNYFTVYNNTQNDFSVNDVISQQRNNTTVNVIDKSFVILNNSQKTIEVGTLNEGSFELLLKGKFTSGASCDYKETTSGYFTSDNYSFSGSDPSCNFTFNYPTIKYVSLDGDFVDISFKNLTNKQGVLKITSTGTVIENPFIYLAPYENISQKLILTNISNPKNIIYEVEVYGCAKKSFVTTLYPFISVDDQKIYFVTYPTSLTSVNKRLISSFVLKNTSENESIVEIKFSGFPNNFVFVANDFMLNENLFTVNDNKINIVLNPSSTKNIYFGVIVPDDASNISYNGYIDVYNKGKIVFNQPFTINRIILKDEIVVTSSFEKINNSKNSVLLNFMLENNSSNIKHLLIYFEDENLFTIEGVKSITLDPSSKVSQSYKVIYDNEPLIKYSVINADTNAVLKQGELNLKEVKDNPGFLTGFLSLAGINWVWDIIIVIIIICIIYIIYNSYKIKKRKKQKAKLNLKKDILSKDVDLENKEAFVEDKLPESNLVSENKDVLPLKEVTFADVDALNKK